MTLEELDLATLPTKKEDDSIPAQLLRYAKKQRERHENHAAALMLEAAEMIADEASCDTVFDFIARAQAVPCAPMVKETPMDRLNLPDMPVYECHKHVRACKVRLHVEPNGGEGRGEGVVAQPIEEFVGVVPPIHLPNAFTNRRIPSHPVEPDEAASQSKLYEGVEGYIVQYNDGYTSWSPVEAFEQGYHGPLPRQSDVLGQYGKQLGYPGRTEGVETTFDEDTACLASFEDMLDPHSAKITAEGWRLIRDGNGWLWKLTRDGTMTRISAKGVAT